MTDKNLQSLDLSAIIQKGEEILIYRDLWLFRIFYDDSGKVNCEVYLSVFGISNCKDKDTAIKQVKKEIGSIVEEYDLDVDYYSYDSYCPNCGCVFVEIKTLHSGWKEFTCMDCDFKWKKKEY